MSNVTTWNDKIIFDDDGFGYRITEGDEGEMVLLYFQEEERNGKTHRAETEMLRLYVGELSFLVISKMREKMEEMEKEIDIQQQERQRKEQQAAATVAADRTRPLPTDIRRGE